MTEERFRKLSFRWNMELEYREQRKDTDYLIPCLLISVDFDQGILKVWVIPTDIHEGNEPQFVHYDHVDLPTKKLKVIHAR